jgi:hypothetical protein
MVTSSLSVITKSGKHESSRMADSIALFIYVHDIRWTGILAYVIDPAFSTARATHTITLFAFSTVHFERFSFLACCFPQGPSTSSASRLHSILTHTNYRLGFHCFGMGRFKAGSKWECESHLTMRLFLVFSLFFGKVVIFAIGWTEEKGEKRLDSGREMDWALEQMECLAGTTIRSGEKKIKK